MKELKSYYRRRLPHYQSKDDILFATFRLVNSLPNTVIAQLIHEREIRERVVAAEQDGEKKRILLAEEHRRYFGHFDDYLDRITNNINWLSNLKVAKVVYDAIMFYDKKEYDVIAFCIMPNHVHLVVDMQRENIPLHSILRRIKTFCSTKSNIILKKKGIFWHGENYDHVVRDNEELKRIINYVLNNPVKAKLCKEWKDWKWTYLNEKYL